MDYNIVELEFQENTDGSTKPLFKIVDADGNDIFFCVTIEEAEEYIGAL